MTANMATKDVSVSAGIDWRSVAAVGTVVALVAAGVYVVKAGRKKSERAEEEALAQIAPHVVSKDLPSIPMTQSEFLALMDKQRHHEVVQKVTVDTVAAKITADTCLAEAAALILEQDPDVAEDPLQLHTPPLSATDVDSLVREYREDPEVRAMLSALAGVRAMAPPSSPKLTVEDMVKIMEMQNARVQHHVEEFCSATPIQRPARKALLPIARLLGLQALVNSEMEAQFGVLPAEVEAAVQADVSLREGARAERFHDAIEAALARLVMF